MDSTAARLIRNGLHLDLGADDRSRLDGGARKRGLLEMLSKHPIVAAEITGIFKISRDPHDISQGGTLFRQNSPNPLDRAGRLLFDRSGNHVAFGILRDLSGDEDEVTGANRRIKRQIRILLPDRADVFAAAAGIVHDGHPQLNAVASMMSRPRMRS